eukprot:2207027-Pyramimonas_sp.AAC.2
MSPFGSGPSAARARESAAKRWLLSRGVSGGRGRADFGVHVKPRAPQFAPHAPQFAPQLRASLEASRRETRRAVTRRATDPKRSDSIRR